MAITASLLQRIQVAAEKEWKDSMLNMTAYNTYTDTALAVKRNQTTKFTKLTDSDRDYTYRLYWMDPCGRGVQDCTPSCNVSGGLPNTTSADYAMDLCKESVPFAVDEELARTNEYGFEELAANLLALEFKALDEWWSQQLLLKMKAFAGVNFWLNGNTYANGTTYIPDNQYNVNLLSYLVRVGIMNKFGDSYIIENGEMFDSIFNAGLNAQTLNGQGAASAAAQIQKKLTFDFWNFQKAQITEDAFIVNRGALLWLTKSRFDTKPRLVTGTTKPQYRWSVESPVIPGIYYDVYAQEDCSVPTGSADEHITHNYKIKTRGGIWNNPLGCSETIAGVTGQSTGIISLSKGAAPSA